MPAIADVELAVALVSDLPLLVDQDEARPVPDPVAIPGRPVVVLRVGVLDPVLLECLGQVRLAVLPGPRREFRCVDADEGESLVPELLVEGDERASRMPPEPLIRVARYEDNIESEVSQHT